MTFLADFPRNIFYWMNRDVIRSVVHIYFHDPRHLIFYVFKAFIIKCVVKVMEDCAYSSSMAAYHDIFASMAIPHRKVGAMLPEVI